MKHRLLLPAIATVALSLLVTAPAAAQSGDGLGLGLGVTSTLTGATGASVTYDTGAFHIDGFFGLIDVGDTAFALGGRFYYTVHSRSSADLSVGGGIALVDNNETDFHFEGGAKVRVFLVPNVAFSASVGIGLILQGEDMADDVIILGGQLTGGLGLTYFFR